MILLVPLCDACRDLREFICTKSLDHESGKIEIVNKGLESVANDGGFWMEKTFIVADESLLTILLIDVLDLDYNIVAKAENA